MYRILFLYRKFYKAVIYGRTFDFLYLYQKHLLLKKVFVLFFILFTAFNIKAQDRKVADSLESVIVRLSTQKQYANNGAKSFAIDTSIVSVCGELIKLFHNVSFDSILFYGQKTLTISKPIAYEKGMALGYNSIGFYYVKTGKFELGKQYFNMALAISKKIKDDYGLCRSLTGLGFAENFKGNALSFHYEALKVAIENHIIDQIAASYHNIGEYYDNNHNPVAAADNYLKAIKINEQPGGNLHYLKMNYWSLGIVYENLLKHKKAIENYNHALKVAQQLHEKSAELNIMIMIAGSFGGMEQYDTAISIYLSSIKLAKELKRESLMYQAITNLGDTYYFIGRYKEALHYDTMAYNYYLNKDDYYAIVVAINTGMVYTKLKDFKKALSYELDALAKTDSTNIEFLKWIYANLSEVYAGMGNYKAAYENYQLYKKSYDSLYNNENREKVLQLQLQSDFQKKESSLKAAQEKKDLQQRNIRNSIIAGLLLLSVFFVVVYRQRNRVKKEKERSDELLLNILPSEVADELKANGKLAAKMYNDVTVLFTDFVDFTGISETLSPEELVAEIHKNFTVFDHIIDKNGLEKIKTIGDAYLAVCGLPIENEQHAQSVVRAAIEINEYVQNSHGKFKVRIGIHSGPVVAGIVGVKKFAYDIWGDTVNTASRMESNSEVGKINISTTTYELVQHDFKCIHRGKINAKGKGDVDMYFVDNSRA